MSLFNKNFRKQGICEIDLAYWLGFNGRYQPNSKFLWSGSDDKISHLRSEKTHPEKFNYWKNRPINYNYNNRGFRSEFDFEPGMEGDIYLGCSFTEGIGLPLKCSWPSLLSAELGVRGFNLGTGGYSIDSCFRYLVSAYQFGLKFKRVFLLVPPPNRYERIIKDNAIFKPFLHERHQEDTIFHTMPNMMNHYWTDDAILTGKNELILSYLIGSEHNALINSYKTTLAIKAFTENTGAKLYYRSFTELNKHNIRRAMRENKKEINMVPARDGHYSNVFHHNLKNIFIKELLGKPII